MKPSAIKLTAILFLILTTIAPSCKKTSSTQPSSFTWVCNGVQYTATVKTAYLYSMAVGPIIIAGTGTSILSPGTVPSISVNSLNVGSYYCGAGSPNILRYIDTNGDELYSNTGTLNITANSNNKLSGNFSGTVLNTANASIQITISFTNILIEN